MKRLLFMIVCAFLVYAPLADLAAGPVLPLDTIYGHLSDWTSVWVTPAGSSGDTNSDGIIGEGEVWVPKVGDEGRAVAQLSKLYTLSGGGEVEHWNSSATSQLVALEYDFVFEALVVGPSGTTVFFEPGPRYGGLIDVYLDESPVLTPVDASAGPGAWVTGPAGPPPVPADTYPTASDGSLWLRGTYAPLYTDTNGNGIRDAGEPMIDADGDGTPSVYRIDNFVGAGDGNATAWVDIFAGSFASEIGQGAYGFYPEALPLGDGSYDIKLQITLNSLGANRLGWQTTSSDPVQFVHIPEPSACLLFACGMGLAGFYRRRKRQA